MKLVFRPYVERELDEAANWYEEHQRQRSEIGPLLRNLERFWLGLQLDYDLEEAQRAVGEAVRKEVHPIAPAA